MTTKWPERTIAECAANEPYATQIGPFGKALTAREYVDHGIPVLRGVNVNSGRFHDDDYVFISEEKANELAKYESFPGDVLLVHKGTLGQIGLMPNNRRHPRYIMGNSMLRVRCNPDVLLPEFLYYWLSSPWGQHYLFSRVSQVGVPQIQTPLKTLREAKLRVPSVSEQRSITNVLGSLDDKIELNRRMSETLDDVARAKFNDTFLGATSTPSTESRKVPVQSFFEILSGGTPKTSEPENWDGPIPWFSVADTPPGSSTFVLDTAKAITERGLETSPAQVVPAWTTIISARGTVGKLAMAGVPLTFNQSCYGLRAINGAGPSFVYLLANHMVEKLKALSHGSVFSTITRRTFDAVQFPGSSKPTLTAFEDSVAPLYQRILLATQESATLAELRDTLLPKLISGELRIPEAEQLVSEVA